MSWLGECAKTSAAAGMDLDLELGTENFTPANSRLWHIASPGQEIVKTTLFHQQVVDRCCLATRDLEILQKESVAEFCFCQSNKTLLLASEHLVLIWSNSACYVSYNDIPSKRFQDFIIAAKSWVSNGLPFDNSLVIRAALNLIYEDMQDQVQKLKSGVEDSWCRTLCDLGEKGSLLSSKSKKVMAEIFNSGSPSEAGGVSVFLEPNQLQEYKKAWDTILEQLDSIRGLLNTKLSKLKTILVLCFVLYVTIVGGGLLYIVLIVVVPKPRSPSSVAICFSLFLSLLSLLHMQLLCIKNRVRAIWLA